ncbi:MAG: alcohol dehydrogenase catalytic domain-containing protein [Paracoccaceae bacterium]|nr:alcohol dehydrogenase catalytic domain-containing protein [Paracoccaceae bacterium]MDE2913258.1 alcohol dehydrogenase catalytic domain-containing protein [Paracoccaceae bacterium]
MKALVYTGPKAMRFTDVPDPRPGPGHSVVQVDSVGICGSDMHGYLGHDPRRTPPLVLGHEAAGVVVAGAQEGRRVTVNPLITCGECRDCRSGRTNICQRRELLSIPPREGAFAELVAVPDGNLIDVPEGISSERAAMVEPMAVCWHAARLAGGLMSETLGDCRILVVGGGAIGFGTAICLQALGAIDILILEPNSVRRRYLASATGFTVIDPADGVPDRGEYDLVADAVGSDGTRAESSRSVRQGGLILHLGLHSATGGLDARRMTLQEIRFQGTYAYTASAFREAAAAVFDNRLGALDWTEIRPLRDGGRAFKDILSGNVPAPKIILQP